MLKSRTKSPGVVLVAAVCLALSGMASAQILEDVSVVSSPTASVLPHGGYLLQGSLGSGSSVILGLKVGFFDRFLLGASYGFQDFIGRGGMEANDKPGFEARLRVVEESEPGPALAVGVNTQGEGVYVEGAERYERKSMGAYAVLSKNYRLIGDFSIHAGVNYSFENRDEGGVDAFGGFVLEVIKGFSILLDYDPALDDNDGGVATHLTHGRGYLDGGLRFDYRDNLRFKILFRDLLDNFYPEAGVERSIEIFYLNSF
jgi:hypothetical protein